MKTTSVAAAWAGAMTKPSPDLYSGLPFLFFFIIISF
jgi:hypothetical protein